MLPRNAADVATPDDRLRGAALGNFAGYISLNVLLGLILSGIKTSAEVPRPNILEFSSPSIAIPTSVSDRISCNPRRRV